MPNENITLINDLLTNLKIGSEKIELYKLSFVKETKDGTEIKADIPLKEDNFQIKGNNLIVTKNVYGKDINGSNSMRIINNTRGILSIYFFEEIDELDETTITIEYTLTLTEPETIMNTEVV